MIQIKHSNGYTGRLFGTSSLSIYDAEEHIVLYTEKRTINTYAELYQLLEEAPDLFKQKEEKTRYRYSRECLKCKKFFDCKGKPNQVERCINYVEN